MQSFDVQELKEYFFGDRLPVEEFDIDTARHQLEELFCRDVPV